MAIAAEVVAPDTWSQAKTPPGPPQSQQPSQASGRAPHGKKRSADGELEGEQRLSKRFDLLNLDNTPSRLYIPVPGSAAPAAPASSQTPNNKSSSITPPPSEGMQVEETPTRIYIHDLSAELADLSSDEDTPVFLPDIEKHLAKIPQHILTGPARVLKPTRENALVLYNVPSSLSVPEEQDRVRRAIVDARARIREKQGVKPDVTRDGVYVTYEVEEMPEEEEEEGVDDADAMELD